MQKTAEYLVTPEAWERHGVLQIPGTVAQRVETPIRVDSTQRVKLSIQMVVVPHKGVYLVGTMISTVKEEIEDEEGSNPPKAEKKRSGLNAWACKTLPRKCTWQSKNAEK